MNQPKVFDPGEHAVGLRADGKATLLQHQPDPSIPFVGATFGVAAMSENSPHGGERHPDGDEVLYLISGRVRIVFVDQPIEDIDVKPGDGLVVPAGVWHRVDILEPSQIVYLTPGPNNEYLPLAGDA